MNVDMRLVNNWDDKVQVSVVEGEFADKIRARAGVAACMPVYILETEEMYDISTYTSDTVHYFTLLVGDTVVDLNKYNTYNTVDALSKWLAEA